MRVIPKSFIISFYNTHSDHSSNITSHSSCPIYAHNDIHLVFGQFVIKQFGNGVFNSKLLI